MTQRNLRINEVNLNKFVSYFYEKKIENYSHPLIRIYLPRLSVADSEDESSAVDELEMSDSVDDSNDFKSRSRSGVS